MTDQNCIFCKIANGEIPAATLYEDENFRVILDLGPASKGHALILPKSHAANIYELPDETAAKAMVLAKKHIRRLWYPEPGHGGDIASRSRYALTSAEFEKRIPNEFWREVVDRCAQEMPDTLLLAEAFWMMEGYFTRTLGMHRVYNSAFMNMLKKEENQKYRDTALQTMERRRIYRRNRRRRMAFFNKCRPKNFQSVYC